MPQAEGELCVPVVTGDETSFVEATTTLLANLLPVRAVTQRRQPASLATFTPRPHNCGHMSLYAAVECTPALARQSTASVHAIYINLT